MVKDLTIAEQLAEVLAAWGVKFIFGTAGDTILPFLDCLGRHPLKFVQFRNEESAAYAASAYAKLTGAVGVVLSHGGPGAGHLVNGLADAKSDGAPVLAITGQVESFYLGTDHKQYINLQQLLGAVTLRSENVGSPQSAATLVLSLLRTALSQGGPVHLSIPKDFWEQKVEPVQVKLEPYLSQGAQSPDPVIDEAVGWLKKLQKPMLLVGRGASQALDEVFQIAERLGAGVVRTLPLAGKIPQHPLDVGGIGEGGSEAAVELLRRCDGLVKVGATYWPTTFTSDQKQTLAIDARPANISRGIPADFGVVGDAKAVLTKLLAQLGTGNARGDWRSEVENEAAAWRRRLEEDLAQSPPNYPGRAVRVISEFTQENAVICLDVGDHVLWFSRFFQGRGQDVLVSGRWRGMGFSLGAAIAAQVTRPKDQVLCLVGDGGFSMLMGELSSAVELELPIIFILMNNRSYAMEANAMEAGGLRPLGVTLRDIRYHEVAQACGALGLRTDPAGLQGSLGEAQKAGKTALIDLQVEASKMPAASP